MKAEFATVRAEYIKVNIPKSVKVLGAKIIDGDKIVIAMKQGANTIIKLIEDVGDDIEKIIESVIEEGTKLYLKLEAFFNDIFNILPTYIEKDNKRYQLVLLPARGKETDFVSYIHFGIGEYSIFLMTEGKTIFKAKNKMHKLLEERQLL